PVISSQSSIHNRRLGPRSTFASAERYTCLCGDIQEVFDDGKDQRHTRLTAHLFCFPFGVARNQGTLGAGGWLGGAKYADVVVDLTLELVSVNEAIDPHRTEKMAYPFAHTAGRSFLPESEGRGKRSPVRATEHAAQHIDHDRQGVTLVASTLAV